MVTKLGVLLVLSYLAHSLAGANANAAGNYTEIEVEPKSTFRTVGNMQEAVTVTKGASELGKAEFKVSCGVGVAYAFLPGEDSPYRFTEQKTCAQILATESAISKCRSTLRLDPKMKLIQVMRTRCGIGGPVAKPLEESATSERSREDLRQGTPR